MINENQIVKQIYEEKVNGLQRGKKPEKIDCVELMRSLKMVMYEVVYEHDGSKDDLLDWKHLEKYYK